jgi:hypothetical protein
MVAKSTHGRDKVFFFGVGALLSWMFGPTDTIFIIAMLCLSLALLMTILDKHR